MLRGGLDPVQLLDRLLQRLLCGESSKRVSGACRSQVWAVEGLWLPVAAVALACRRIIPEQARVAAEATLAIGDYRLRVEILPSVAILLIPES